MKLKLKLAVGLAALLVNGAAVGGFLVDGAGYGPLLDAIELAVFRKPVAGFKKPKPFAPAP
jgi:hypothetical protein